MPGTARAAAEDGPRIPEVSAPTDVKHLGPDACIALLKEQAAAPMQSCRLQDWWLASQDFPSELPRRERSLSDVSSNSSAGGWQLPEDSAGGGRQSPGDRIRRALRERIRSPEWMLDVRDKLQTRRMYRRKSDEAAPVYPGKENFGEAAPYAASRSGLGTSMSTKWYQSPIRFGSGRSSLSQPGATPARAVWEQERDWVRRGSH